MPHDACNYCVKSTRAATAVHSFPGHPSSAAKESPGSHGRIRVVKLIAKYADSSSAAKVAPTEMTRLAEPDKAALLNG